MGNSAPTTTTSTSTASNSKSTSRQTSATTYDDEDDATPASSSASSRNNNTATNTTTTAVTNSTRGAVIRHRRAYHGGSWYSADPVRLHQQLDGFLSKAAAATEAAVVAESSSQYQQQQRQQQRSQLRALIVPHAGYTYSGMTAGYAYNRLRHELMLMRNHTNNTNATSPGTKTPIIKQIVVLHPSHHEYVAGCAISGATALETPFGHLRVDTALRDEILALSRNASIASASSSSTVTSKKKKNRSTSCNDDDDLFTIIDDIAIEEREHSAEMQFPFLAKLFTDRGLLSNDREEVTVLPIMCGALSPATEQRVGRLLSPILTRPHIVTIVSTDFCHYGQRFGYQPTASTIDLAQLRSEMLTESATAKKTNADIADNNNDDNDNNLSRYIRELDLIGMDLIQLQEPGAFTRYLQKTRNTICGRHAVGVWLNAVVAANDDDDDNTNTSAAMQVELLHYDQSCPRVETIHDSSVSYVAAMATTTTT